MTFVQRFGGALNLNVHFHTLDGVYAEDKQGRTRFHRAPPPSDAEVARVAGRIHRRAARLMVRRGLGPQADPEEADTLLRDQPLLAELYAASVAGRAAMGSRSGRPLTKLGDAFDAEDLAALSGPRCALIAGFSVHATSASPPVIACARNDWRVTPATPPLAAERLSLVPDGRLLCRLKRRGRDGTMYLIFDPLDFVTKLAAPVPPPRFNLVRYSGVLAPSAGWRPLVVPSEAEDTGAYSCHGRGY